MAHALCAGVLLRVREVEIAGEGSQMLGSIHLSKY